MIAMLCQVVGVVLFGMFLGRAIERNRKNDLRLYVVTMYRHANRENHSYVLGVFTNENLARRMAGVEQINRGGNKYYPEVLEYAPNSAGRMRTVTALVSEAG